MHKVYYLSLLALLFSVAVAQDCILPTNRNFTTITPICRPTYNITKEFTNATGVALSSLFSSIHPSPACANAFAQYYCTKDYAVCDNAAQNETCKSTCDNVLASCNATDVTLFNSASLPFPSVADCDALNTTECRPLAAVELTAYYDSCAVPDLSLLAIGSSNAYVCAINHTVTISANSYSLGGDVFENLGRRFSMAYGDSLPDTAESCFLRYSNFYCSQAFPPCYGDLDANKHLPVCRSACYMILQECDNYTTAFNTGKILFPNVTYCNALPTSGCYTPNTADVNLAYFSFHAPTPPPTLAPTYPPGEGIEYPPGGPGKGAGVGVGVLLGLLLVILGLTLIMKKQDSR